MSGPLDKLAVVFDTLRTKCWYMVEPVLPVGVVGTREVKEMLGKLHVRVEGEAVSSFAPNRVLAAAPPISLSE